MTRYTNCRDRRQDDCDGTNCLHKYLRGFLANEPISSYQSRLDCFEPQNRKGRTSPPLGYFSMTWPQRFGTGHQRTNPSRFGILTCGKDLASSTASSGTILSIDRMYAVTAYTSSLVSDCGDCRGIARRT